MTGVTVVTGVPPALIAFRDEASATWKTPTSTSTGTFALDVTGPYRVVVACEGSSTRRTFIVQYARTLDDERTLQHPCQLPATRPLHVRGQMLQSGEVFLGFTGRGQTAAPWSFDLAAAAGTYDFLALFGDLSHSFDQIAIRRDVAITGDLDLGAIDAAQEHAQAMVATQFTATNLAADESLMSTVLLHAGNTRAALATFVQPESAWQVGLVPFAALRATDTQDVELFASSSTSDPDQLRDRNLTRRAREGGSTSITLMDPPGQTTFESTADRLVATWASLPLADEIDVSRISFSTDFSQFASHDLLISRAFLAATGITSATLDVSDVPGFRPEWRHDPTFDQMFGLTAFRGTLPDDAAVAEVTQPVPAPAPGVAPRQVDAQRARATIDAHRDEVQRLRGGPSAQR